MSQLKKALQRARKERKNRRRYVRNPCLIAVDYCIGDFIYRDFIKNISVNGVFIETRESFRTGLDLTMSFALHDCERPVKIQGKIVRDVPDGIGIILQTKAEQNLHSLVEAIRDQIIPKHSSAP